MITISSYKYMRMRWFLVIKKGCGNMKEKQIEYYMDSRIYKDEDIQKKIEDTKKDFGNKKFEVSIFLNRFGIYEIVFEFTQKESIFTRIRLWFKQKKIKMISESQVDKISKEKNRLNKYSGNQYGKYKETRTYRPY